MSNLSDNLPKPGANGYEAAKASTGCLPIGGPSTSSASREANNLTSYIVSLEGQLKLLKERASQQAESLGVKVAECAQLTDMLQKTVNKIVQVAMRTDVEFTTNQQTTGQDVCDILDKIGESYAKMKEDAREAKADLDESEAADWVTRIKSITKLTGAASVSGGVMSVGTQLKNIEEWAKTQVQSMEGILKTSEERRVALERIQKEVGIVMTRAGEYEIRLAHKQETIEQLEKELAEVQPLKAEYEASMDKAQAAIKAIRESRDAHRERAKEYGRIIWDTVGELGLSYDDAEVETVDVLKDFLGQLVAYKMAPGGECTGTLPGPSCALPVAGTYELHLDGKKVGNVYMGDVPRVTGTDRMAEEAADAHHWLDLQNVPAHQEGALTLVGRLKLLIKVKGPDPEKVKASEEAAATELVELRRELSRHHTAHDCYKIPCVVRKDLERRIAVLEASNVPPKADTLPPPAAPPKVVMGFDVANGTDKTVVGFIIHEDTAQDWISAIHRVMDTYFKQYADPKHPCISVVPAEDSPILSGLQNAVDGLKENDKKLTLCRRLHGNRYTCATCKKCQDNIKKLGDVAAKHMDDLATSVERRRARAKQQEGRKARPVSTEVPVECGIKVAGPPRQPHRITFFENGTAEVRTVAGTKTHQGSWGDVVAVLEHEGHDWRRLPVIVGRQHIEGSANPEG